MAEVDDLEFWLPSEEDLFTDFKIDPLNTGRNRNDDFSYGFPNSWGISSDLSSPTTETESDDDDRVTELTRKLAHSTLHDSSFSSSKGWKSSGSPQSTLCGCKQSPNSLSGFCSPPEAEDRRRWDILYAAAGEVARMRMIEETAAFYTSKLYAAHAKPSPVTAPRQSPNPASHFYPTQTQSHLSHQMLQAAKFQQMKQHQMMKNGAYGAEFQSGRRNGGETRPQGASMATWPVQQTGSGMRAVFLGETGVKKERTGTGVFLPQRFGSVPAETRKKPGCSTVLLPDKVVHALNLNRDAIDAQAQNLSLNIDYETGLNHRNNMMAQQRRRQTVMNQQLRLPQEWTY